MANARCRLHGGKSTGPRTPEGRERARFARWKHGRRSAPRLAALKAYRDFLRNTTRSWTGDDEVTINAAHDALLHCQLLAYRADLARVHASKLGRGKLVKDPVYPFPHVQTDRRAAFEAEILGETTQLDGASA